MAADLFKRRAAAGVAEQAHLGYPKGLSTKLGNARFKFCRRAVQHIRFKLGAERDVEVKPLKHIRVSPFPQSRLIRWTQAGRQAAFNLRFAQRGAEGLEGPDNFPCQRAEGRRRPGWAQRQKPMIADQCQRRSLQQA